MRGVSNGVEPLLRDGYRRLLDKLQRRMIETMAVPAEILGVQKMNVKDQVHDVRRRMLSGDKQQAFVSGDVQPGRPVEIADVKDRHDGDDEGPAVDTTPRR